MTQTGWAGSVFESAHRLHAVLDEEELQVPDHDPGANLQRRMTEDVVRCVELEQALVADETREDGTQGRRMQVVSETGDDGSHDAQDVRAGDAERGASENGRGKGKRKAGPHARDADHMDE